MKTQIEVSYESLPSLIEKGYELISVEGANCLDESERTLDNILFGELTLNGARILAERVSKEKDMSADKVTIYQLGSGMYDVYKIKSQEGVLVA